VWAAARSTLVGVILRWLLSALRRHMLILMHPGSMEAAPCAEVMRWRRMSLDKQVAIRWPRTQHATRARTLGPSAYSSLRCNSPALLTGMPGWAACRTEGVVTDACSIAASTESVAVAGTGTVLYGGPVCTHAGARNAEGIQGVQGGASTQGGVQACTQRQQLSPGTSGWPTRPRPPPPGQQPPSQRGCGCGSARTPPPPPPRRCAPWPAAPPSSLHPLHTHAQPPLPQVTGLQQPLVAPVQRAPPQQRQWCPAACSPVVCVCPAGGCLACSAAARSGHPQPAHCSALRLVHRRQCACHGGSTAHTHGATIPRTAPAQTACSPAANHRVIAAAAWRVARASAALWGRSAMVAAMSVGGLQGGLGQQTCAPGKCANE
jgi:hypothetical protein